MGGKSTKKLDRDCLPEPDLRAEWSNEKDVWYVLVNSMKQTEQVFVVVANTRDKKSSKADQIIGLYDKRILAEIHVDDHNTAEFPDDLTYSLIERSVLGLAYEIGKKKILNQITNLPLHVYSSLPPFTYI